MAMSAKNFSLSPAADALGLGDQLRAQVEDEVDSRKKKLQALQMQGKQNLLSPASMSLFGPTSGGGLV